MDFDDLSRHDCSRHKYETDPNTPGSIHNSMDGMYLENGNLYVGLTSVFDAASGFQVLDTTSRIWNEAELLAAPPANDIGDFLRLGNVTLVTTPVGIGRFDESAQEWLDPITTYDGLPPDSDRIEVASSNRTSKLGSYLKSKRTLIHTEPNTKRLCGYQGDSIGRPNVLVHSGHPHPS